MPSADLTREATEATRRARLAEQVLLDRVVDRAAATLRTSGQIGSSVPVVWTVSDVATTPDGIFQGSKGDLWLMPSDAAWSLVDEGFADRREPLKLAGSRRAEAADDLRQVAGELLEAAAALDSRMPAAAVEGASKVV